MTPIAFAEFRAYAELVYQSRAQGTLKKVQHVLGLLEQLGVRSTADLTTTLVARLVASRGTKNRNTTLGLLCYVKALCSLAIEEDWLDHRPNFRRVSPRPSASTRKRDFSPGEIGRLLGILRSRSNSWQGGRIHALAVFIASTGLRRSEALAAKVEDLDLAGGIFRIVERDRPLKTFASAAEVPLPPHAVAVLREWVARCDSPWLFPGLRRSGPWLGGAIGWRPIDELQLAARDAGIGWVSWHALRHSFATNALREWGLSVWTVQRILRHTSIRTTQLYLHARGVRDLVPQVACVAYPCPSPSASDGGRSTCVPAISGSAGRREASYRT